MSAKRQTRLFILVFASLFALLALGYWFFLRTQYAVLYTGLKPADAAVAVADLDAKAIDYRLRDDGTTIAVPSTQVDNVRLAMIGSDASSKGLIGFELFNKSDMGLTDFAQKINYQRALQGELARTIMTMDGIESARVHLAIPDRSLFRGTRSEPKAAVTLIGERGRPIDGGRVAGVQRLVAASVPELALANVAVLDDVGRVISQAAELDPLVAPEAEERAAVQQYYRARVRSAAEKVMPGLKFEVRVLLLDAAGQPAMGGWDSGSGEVMGAVAANPEDRDFGLRILFITNSAINPGDQELLRNAVADAVALRRTAGDTLVFAVEPLGGGTTPPVPAAAAEPDPMADAPPGSVATAGELAGSNGWVAALAALIGLCAILIATRRRAPGRSTELSTKVREDYVARIRRRLKSSDDGGARA